jgi:hypothetical protein
MNPTRTQQLYRAISALGLALTTYALMDAQKTKKINEEANLLSTDTNNKIDDLIKEVHQTHINLTEFYNRIRNGEKFSKAKIEEIGN